jgi:predicted  nucleic acid-binding Zn-ribbon protein
MAIDTKEISDDHERFYKEGELISSLEELENERKKNKLLKKELSKIKESTQDPINSKETQTTFMDLKVKLEEVKMIEKSLREQVEEKESIQTELENEIVSLRRKLQRENIK